MSQPNRETSWRMFTLQDNELAFRSWSELANIDFFEIPVLAHEYWLGGEGDVEKQFYRVAWVDPYHRHFGAVFRERG